MIRQGEHKYIPDLKQIWKLCFPMDTDVFIDFYFEKVYKNEETLVFIDENKPIASLQMIPFPIKMNQNISLAGYISGAMTHPDFRKKGYMEQLLNASFDAMKEKGFNYSFLIPQEEWLFDFYAKYGYEKAFPLELKTISCMEEQEMEKRIILRDKEVRIYKSLDSVDVDNFFIIYSRFLMGNDKVVLKTKSQTTNVLEDFFQDEGILFANDWGIAFTFKIENEVFIQELFYVDSEVKTDFLNVIFAYYKTERITLQSYFSSDSSEYRGMIKSFDESSSLSKDIYMSMMLD